MKVLMLNGSPHEKGCTYTALAEVAGELNQAGIETEIMHVGAHPQGSCMGCGGCSKTGTLCFGRRGYHLLPGPFLLFRKQCCCP